MEKTEKRYIGLDVHKHYLIALGVDEDLNIVLPARRVELSRLEAWMKKTLTKQDAVVLEMTTNTRQLYDELVAYAGSVMVVHPPHVALITRSQVTPAPTAGAVCIVYPHRHPPVFTHIVTQLYVGVLCRVPLEYLARSIPRAGVGYDVGKLPWVMMWVNNTRCER